MKNHGHDALVDAVERNYDLNAIESTENGLFYLQDNNDRNKIGIMTCRNGKRSIAILTKKQAYALIEEFKDICDMYLE
jgi:hypothetical protein